MNILDLSDDIKKQRLAHLGLTEDEYKARMKQQDAEREHDEQFRVPEDQVQDKFKTVPGGIVYDDD